MDIMDFGMAIYLRGFAVWELGSVWVVGLESQER